MGDPFLRCNFVLSSGSLELCADFALAAEWTCLFGPSGSGKTTILRVIAGHLHPLSGSLTLADGTPLADTATSTFVPAHRRPFRTAPQSTWLLPGTVLSNLRYGVAGRHPSQLDELLELFELSPLADRDVRQLSGGQSTRVSLARTIAAAIQPDTPITLLLLDEPFTGLDLKLRQRLIPTLRRFLRERNLPVLSVTHDAAEALLLQAEVLRVQDGRVLAQGPAAEVLAPERELLRRALDGPFPTDLS